MKAMLRVAVSAFKVLFFLSTVDAQTKAKKNRLPPYEDAEGYRVLSSVIDARRSEWKGGSVSIFYRTVSKQAIGKIMSDCSSKIPGSPEVRAHLLSLFAVSSWSSPSIRQLVC